MATPSKADALRRAFHTCGHTYVGEDKANGLRPASLWSIAADAVRAEVYVKLALELEGTGRSDRSAALAKMDELDACLDEPRGSFYKASKRLFETLKAKSDH